jgi:hypothetical protein
MIASLLGYVVNSAVADPRTRQNLAWPSGESGQINLAILNTSGSAYDLTGGQVLFTARDAFGNVVISRQATINSPSSGGTCYFPLSVADTAGLAPLFDVALHYDCWVTDASGNRFQVVPFGTFSIAKTEGTPAQPVTPAPSQNPLAQGPAGIGLARTSQIANYSPKFLEYVAGNVTAGGFTVTLPLASTAIGTSNVIAVKNISYASPNVLTVAPTGGDTIDGFNLWFLNAGESRIFFASNGLWESL